MKVSKRQVLEAVIRKSLIGEDVDLKQFPNPLPQDWKGETFLTKGFKDDNKTDDKVDAGPDGLPAQDAKPSQSAIYLGKALGMAIGGIKGGQLNAIISQDDYILDGHHRWAATMFSAPEVDVKGTRINMTMKDLIPILRAAGDAYGNPRRGEPEGGDANIFGASLEDALAVIKKLDGGNDRLEAGAAQKWLDGIGGEEVLSTRLDAIKAKGAAVSKAPPRSEMPVIDADKGEDGDVATRFRKGALDVNPPYTDIKPREKEIRAMGMNEKRTNEGSAMSAEDDAWGDSAENPMDPIDWANEYELDYETDNNGNVVIYVEPDDADRINLPTKEWDVQQDNEGRYVIYTNTPYAMNEAQGFKTTHDEDGDLLYILPFTFSGDIDADVREMFKDEKIADLLWGELGSDEGITDESGEHVYWGSDVQDIVQGLHEGTLTEQRRDRVAAERYGLLMERMLGIKGLTPLNTIESKKSNWLFEEEEEEGEEVMGYCADRSFLSAIEAEDEKEKAEEGANWSDAEIKAFHKRPKDLKNH